MRGSKRRGARRRRAVEPRRRVRSAGDRAGRRPRRRRRPVTWSGASDSGVGTPRCQSSRTRSIAAARCASSAAAIAADRRRRAAEQRELARRDAGVGEQHLAAIGELAGQRELEPAREQQLLHERALLGRERRVVATDTPGGGSSGTRRKLGLAVLRDRPIVCERSARAAANSLVGDRRELHHARGVVVAEQQLDLRGIVAREPAQELQALLRRRRRIAEVVVEVIADRDQHDVVGQAIAVRARRGGRAPRGPWRTAPAGRPSRTCAAGRLTRGHHTQSVIAEELSRQPRMMGSSRGGMKRV